MSYFDKLDNLHHAHATMHCLEGVVHKVCNVSPTKHIFCISKAIESDTKLELSTEFGCINEPQCLLVEADEKPVALPIVKAFSSAKDLIAYFPEWLIETFEADNGEKFEWRAFNAERTLWALSLCFVSALLTHSHIEVSFREPMKNRMRLITRCVYLKSEQRDELLENGLPVSIYQTHSNIKITDNSICKPIGFKLIGSNLVIYNENANHIVEVKLEAQPYDGTRVVLHYDECLLRLYAKRNTNCVVINYNYSSEDNFDAAVDYERLRQCKITLKWAHGSETDNGTVHLATKTMNLARMKNSHSGLLFPIHNLGNIKDVEYSWFSSYCVTDGVYIEGYWFEGDYSDTRFPIPTPATEKVEQTFIDKLNKILSLAEPYDQTTSSLTAETEKAKEENDFNRNVEHDNKNNNSNNLRVVQKSYLGSSSCRLCKTQNGSDEYIIQDNTTNITFTVPSGFVHYLEHHNIHPSPLFKTFVESHSQNK